MGDYNAIRGRTPTKTETILEYLVNRENKILTPKEVAEGLDFNLQTTVTVLNRLALEGAIAKIDRGQFCYEGIEEGAIPEPQKEKAAKIDKKTARTIFYSIYDMASESTGVELIGSLTGVNKDDFDESEPIRSIKDLVRALIDVLGKEIADDIVSIVLENEIHGEENLQLLKMF